MRVSFDTIEWDIGADLDPKLLCKESSLAVDPYHFAGFAPSVGLQPYLPSVFTGHKKLDAETAKL